MLRHGGIFDRGNFDVLYWSDGAGGEADDRQENIRRCVSLAGFLHESMSMIDLSQETELLARRLADAEHLTVDAAVRQALEARAQAAGVELQPIRAHDRSPEAIAARRAYVDKIVSEIAAMPILDHRTPQEIIDDLSSI